MPHAWEAHGQEDKRNALLTPPSTGKTTATSTALTVKYTHTGLLLCYVCQLWNKSHSHHERGVRWAAKTSPALGDSHERRCSLRVPNCLEESIILVQQLNQKTNECASELMQQVCLETTLIFSFYLTVRCFGLKENWGDSPPPLCLHGNNFNNKEPQKTWSIFIYKNTWEYKK